MYFRFDVGQTNHIRERPLAGRRPRAGDDLDGLAVGVGAAGVDGSILPAVVASARREVAGHIAAFHIHGN